MAGYSATGVKQAVASSAEFQATVQTLEAALLSSGFLEVAPDTGQIDPTSVTLPTAGAYAGYRIYRAKDTLAATKPVYLKVEYGLSSSNAHTHLRVTPSTGTNGAGTPNGFVGGSTTVTPSSPPSSPPPMQVFGGGGAAGAIVACKAGSSTSNSFIFGVSRACDSSNGAPNNKAVFFLYTASGGTAVSAYRTDGSSAWTTGSGSDFHPTVSSSNMHTRGSGAQVVAFRGIAYLVGDTYDVPWLLGIGSEFPLVNAASAFTATWCGSTHTFIPFTDTVSPSAGTLCMLFE